MMNKKNLWERSKTGTNYWYNFILLAVDSGGFSFAVNMLSHLTIVPYYLNNLTDSNLIIGLAPMLFILGQLFPQVFIANYINGLKQRKKYIVLIAVAERVGILLIFLSVLFFAQRGAFAAIFTFLLSYIFFTSTLGLIMPAHTDLVARSINRMRGIYYGVAFFLGGIAGLAGARLASYFLYTYLFPQNYIRIFGLALVVPVITLVFWIFIKEPAYGYAPSRKPVGVYFAYLKKLLQENKEYTKFLCARIVLNLCEIATPFYAIFAVARFDLPSGMVGTFTMILFVAQALFNLLWGYIGDRFGFKRVLQLTALQGTASAVAAIFAPNAAVFYLVFVLVGAMWGSFQVANVNLAIEFSRPEETPTFVGLMNTAQAPALALAPLIGGFLADNFGYRITIIVGLILFAFAAVFISCYMKDPRQLKKETVAGRNYFPGG